MDIVDRYVAAVGRQLPPRQAADIQAELRDELLTRIEAREGELGRPLSSSEVEGLLQEFGHPLVVAGRYRRTQYLIGPEVFPFWWATVKWMLAITAGVSVVLLSLAIAVGKSPAGLKGGSPSMFGVVIYLFGVITLAFAAFEQFGKTAVLRQWKPSRLPPAGKRRSAFELAAEIATNLVFLAWWFGAIRFREFVPAPAFLTIALAPVWAAWRWPIAVYSGLEIACDLVAIVRPAWVRFYGWAMIARSAFGLVILSQVLRAGHWIIVGGLPVHALEEAQRNFDLALRAGLVLTMLGLAIRLGIEAWRLYRLRLSPAGALRPA